MKIDVQKIVARLSDECFEAHRGAFWWDEPARVAVAFGNDGFTKDPRAQAEVAALRRLFAERGGKELGFATDDDHDDGPYSWAMACELPEHLTPEVVEAVLWHAWTNGKDAAGAMALDWDGIRAGLESGRWPSVGGVADAFAGYQANIARAVLERNALA